MSGLRPDYEPLLAQRRIASLGTLNEDGTLHLTAVWYLWEDGVFFVPTFATSRKARNVAARPHAALMVDARANGSALSGIAASGPAEVLRGAASRAVNERIWARYLTEQGLADGRVGGAIATSDDVTIRLEPARIHSWSTAQDFDGAFERPGTTLPLEA